MSLLRTARQSRDQSFDYGPVLGVYLEVLYAFVGQAQSALVLVVGAGDDLRRRIEDAVSAEVSVIPVRTLGDASTLLREVAPVPGSQTRQIQIGALLIDLDRREVTSHGRLVGVTPQEFLILRTLGERSGMPVSFDELLERVWRQIHRRDSGAVRMAIGRLREKLKTHEVAAEIESVHGFGYRLDARAEPRLRIVREPST